MEKESFVTQNSFYYGITKNEASPYVMKGKACDKTLDTYHLILAPTYACNLRCKHCYLPDHDNLLLPKEIALRLIDEWNEMVMDERGQYKGIFHIKGGEPFVVPYLWDVIDRLCAMKTLHLMITTNGTFVEDGNFKRLQNCKNELNGHLVVIVSLDGTTEETHSILRGKGQFGSTMKFLDGLRKYGIVFYLNCVLHKGNIHEISEYIDMAKKYGATQINFISLVPKGRGSSYCRFQIPHLEVYRHLEIIFQNSDRDTKDLLVGSLPHIKSQEFLSQCLTSKECVAAYRGLFYITPDGNAYTCPNMVFPEFSVGNVFGQSLRELSKNLKINYQKLEKYSASYTCCGEKILYEKNDDIENQFSLKSVHERVANTQENKSSSDILMSYCYSRNF